MKEADLVELTSKISLMHDEFAHVMETAKANDVTLSMLYLCTTYFNEFLRTVMEKADPEHGALVAEDLAGIANNWIKTGELRIWGSRNTEKWAGSSIKDGTGKTDELI